MPRFGPVILTVTSLGGGAVNVAVSGSPEAYQFDIDLVRQILLGREKPPTSLLFQVAAGLDAAGFVFAGKTPAQIKAAIEALTNVVW